jgi:hypothetical protein
MEIRVDYRLLVRLFDISINLIRDIKSSRLVCNTKGFGSCKIKAVCEAASIKA